MTLKNMLATIGKNEAVLRETAVELLKVTRGCRPDMHEPDEQDVTAIVRGRVFDNAGTDKEIVVSFRKGVEDSGCTASINLATLVALARIGAQALLDKEV